MPWTSHFKLKNYLRTISGAKRKFNRNKAITQSTKPCKQYWKFESLINTKWSCNWNYCVRLEKLNYEFSMVIYVDWGWKYYRCKENDKKGLKLPVRFQCKPEKWLKSFVFLYCCLFRSRFDSLCRHFIIGDNTTRVRYTASRTDTRQWTTQVNTSAVLQSYPQTWI